MRSIFISVIARDVQGRRIAWTTGYDPEIMYSFGFSILTNFNSFFFSVSIRCRLNLPKFARSVSACLLV
jgi:hypothetical protein